MRTKATAVKSRRNRDLTVKRTSNPTSRYWIPCVGLSSLAVLVISYIQLYSSPYLSDSHFEILNLEDSLVGEGPCKYHGNCPAGSVCAVGGTCRPYWNEKLPKLSQAPTTSLEAISDLKMKDCLMSCLKELSVEEEEQYGSVPVVGATYKAASPHHGCVLDFQRSTTSAGKIGSMESRPPDEEFRLAQRFRSVMRVDYVQSSFPNNKSNNNNPKPSFNDTAATSWRAFCHSPCEKDSDCPSNYECRGRTMYRPPNKETAVVFANRCQPKLPPLRRGEKNDDSMIVVTGANSGYFHGLSNFATSLYYWEPHRKMVVYNLGMSEAQLKEVEKYPNLLTLKWRDGFPSSFPPHISGNLKNYAWKSLAINESVHEHDSIFWFDGGGTIVGPLDPIEEIIQLHGVFLVKGQDADMERLTHPDSYSYFGYNKENFRGGPSYAGNTQGYVNPSRFVDLIVKPNAECAWAEECISPPGSSLGNHRYDQSTLSILAYQPHIRAPHYTEFLAASQDQMRNGLDKESPPFLLWTSRQGCSHYVQNHGFDG